MTLERLQPIGFAEARQISSEPQEHGLFIGLFEAMLAAQVLDSQQARSREQLLLRQSIPASEHLAHAFAPSTASFSRNSATRLPATAALYERWTEYRRWAESLSSRSFLPYRSTMARFFFR